MNDQGQQSFSKPVSEMSAAGDLDRALEIEANLRQMLTQERAYAAIRENQLRQDMNLICAWAHQSLVKYAAAINEAGKQLAGLQAFRSIANKNFGVLQDWTSRADAASAPVFNLTVPEREVQVHVVNKLPELTHVTDVHRDANGRISGTSTRLMPPLA